MLWTGAAMLLLGGVSALAWALLAPLETVSAAGVGPATRPATRPAELEVVYAADFRPALLAGAQVAEVAQGPLPPLALVGTVGDSLALLRTSANVVEVKAIGEKLLGAEVLAVRSGEVDLRYNGKVVTLKKPPESGRAPIR